MPVLACPWRRSEVSDSPVGAADDEVGLAFAGIGALANAFSFLSFCDPLPFPKEGQNCRYIHSEVHGIRM